jgi:hypothetical protein
MQREVKEDKKTENQATFKLENQVGMIKGEEEEKSSIEHQTNKGRRSFQTRERNV